MVDLTKTYDEKALELMNTFLLITYNFEQAKMSAMACAQSHIYADEDLNIFYYNFDINDNNNYWESVKVAINNLDKIHKAKL